MSGLCCHLRGEWHTGPQGRRRMPLSRHAPCLHSRVCGPTVYRMELARIPKRTSTHVSVQNGTPKHGQSATAPFSARHRHGRCVAWQGMTFGISAFVVAVVQLGSGIIVPLSPSASLHLPRSVLQDQWARTAASQIPQQIDRSPGRPKLPPVPQRWY